MKIMKTGKGKHGGKKNERFKGLEDLTSIKNNEMNVEKVVFRE